MRTILFFIAVCFGLAGATMSSARAATSTFTFGGNGGSLLGQIGVYAEAASAADFFNRVSRSGTPPFAPASNGLHFFLHHDTTTDVYALGAFLDSRNDGTGGTLRGTISGLPLSAVVALSNDNNEAQLVAPGSVALNFRWVDCCIDGFVITGIDPDNLNVSIDLNSISGLDSVYLASPSAVTSVASLTGDSFSLTVSSAPEPAVWMLMILGFAGVATQLKRRRYHGMGSAEPSLASPRLSPPVPLDANALAVDRPARRSQTAGGQEPFDRAA